MLYGISFFRRGMFRAVAGSLFILMSATPVALQAQSSPRLTREELAEIREAGSADEFLNLARQFVIQQKTDAARMCVENAIEARPELLTDDTPDNSDTWNAFWFRERGRIRLERLAENDVEGRFDLARWLHQAGVYDAARDLLREVLDMDPDHPQARALARQWHLFGGGPIQFDLTLALNVALLHDTLPDEAKTSEPSRGNRLLLVPFRYKPRERQLNFSKSDLKATFQDGKTRSSEGILLLTSAHARPRSGSTQEITRLELDLPAGNEPIWERMIVEAPEDDAGATAAGDPIYALTCYNTRRPRDPSERRSSSRSRSSRDRPTDTIQDRQGNGYAAFVIEVPDDMTTADLDLDGKTSLKLEKPFLMAISPLEAEVSDATDKTATRLARALVPYLSADSEEVARVTVLRLSSIRRDLIPSADTRTPSPPRLDPGESPAAPPLPPLLANIDQALLSALAHKADRVSQAAFDVLINTPTPLHPDIMKVIAESDATQASLILDQIEALLSDMPPGTPIGETHRRGVQPQRDGDDNVEGLPVSNAPENIFGILEACLQSPHAALRERALRICLTDGSQQSIRLLRHLGPSAHQALVNELSRVEDARLQGTILRVLILSVEESAIPNLLQACEGLRLEVESPTDPLLLKVAQLQSADTAVKLLKLLTLARFDDSLLEDPELSRTILAVPDELWNQPLVQAELYKLAAFPLRLDYHSPVDFDAGARTSRRSRSKPSSTLPPFEAVLTRLATHPESHPTVFKASAAQLLASGRIGSLSEELGQPDASPLRREDLVRHLTHRQEYWVIDALPVFLAQRLRDSDPESIQLAGAFLLQIPPRMEPTQAGLFFFAVKQTVSEEELLKLTAHEERRIATLASQLLSRLTLMSQDDEQAFIATLAEQERKERLGDRNKQLAQEPSGPFVAAVRLELLPTVNPEPSRRSRGRTPQRSPEIHLLIPAGMGQFADTGQSPPPILLGQTNLTMTDSASRVSTPSVKIDATPLIRQALRDATDERAKNLIQSTNLAFLSDELPCDVKYEAPGTWMGMVSIPNANRERNQTLREPYRINRATLVLEMIPPRTGSPAGG